MKKIKDFNIAIIGFSTNALTVGRCLRDGFEKAGYQVRLDGKSKYITGSIPESHREWTESRFKDSNALIFVCSCGIAVRSIAPFLRSKKEDPAVLVVDECGKVVISLLSGHLGGGNDLTREAAEIIGAFPVITTATDLHNRFAVDIFAKKNRCTLHPMWAAKEASAALLAGEPVGFFSEFEVEGELPEGLVRIEQGSDGTFHPADRGRSMPAIGIAVTVHSHCAPFHISVRVIPEAVWLGVGCKKGKESDALLTFLDMFMTENRIDPRSLAGIASIDIKKEEAGILSVVEQYQTRFQTFSNTDLAGLPGVFSSSSFVQEAAGVDNVCERSAVRASGGKLIVPKKAEFGMTAAAAVEPRVLKYNV